MQKSVEIEMLQGQVRRAKEAQELLQQQLADAQVEVDTIYEVRIRFTKDQYQGSADAVQAFNIELDGMFNDAQLPPTEAFEAMKQDLQAAKASRNELVLENMKLKRELEEANLKREQ
jgi:hypothetical protein